jgi:asparagine synthase (glutamine-hydrolysing)
VIPDAFAALVHHFDEPFGDTSAIPSLYLAEMTRRHVTVALSGDGADEMFAGYRRYRFGVAEERIRNLFPEMFRKSVFRIAGSYYPKLDWAPRVFRAKTTLTNIAQGLGDAYFTSMTAFRDHGLRQILAGQPAAELSHYNPRRSFVDRFLTYQEHAPLEQLQAVDFETYLPGDILVKADRTTMAHSLETRSPFLDYRIAELAASLPSAFKLSGGIGKLVLKRAMKHYIPPKLLTRPKMGFTPPVAQWLRSSLKPAFHKLVLRPEMDAYLNASEVRRLWNEHQSGRHNHDKKLWNLLVLAAWDAGRLNGSKTEILAEATASIR